MVRATRFASFAPTSSSFRFVFTSLSIAVMILAALAASAAAWAQVTYTGTAAAQNFGSQAVGSTSAAATLSFSIAAGTTVGSIAVVTTGISNLDFTNSGGGTCATQNYTLPATCTVDVKFKPEFAGPRKGAVVFFSEAKNSGTVLGQVLIYGTGTAPQIGYSPSPTTSFTLGCCYGLFLSNVRGMTVDAAGNQFIASTDGNYVVKLPADGGTSAASAISPVANGKGLSQPSGVAIDGAGDLLIADSSNNRVVILPSGGGAATALDPAVDGKGLSYPMGLSVNGAGDLFIADAANGRVVEEPAGGGAAVVISPVAAGKGLNTWVPDVAVDAAGDLFILDESNLRVVEMPAGGGTPLAISPTANGSGLSNPYGIAVDAAGNLFITDNPKVRVVEVPAGGAPAFVVNLNGSTLYNPVGMAVDGPGNLYIVDNSHVRILELQRSLSLPLNFPTVTGVDTIDTTDGTQTVQVQNLGNNALTLSGVNYPADFPEVNGDANACTSSTGLSAGQRCDLPVEFAPTESGPLSEQIVLTDNALNVTGAQQSIAVNGTGKGPAPPSMKTPPPGSTLTGAAVTFTWNPGYGSSAFMLKAGTTGAGSSDIYSGGSTTATSVTVSNIPTIGRTLYVQLSYEMGTTWTSINYTYAEFGPPPIGYLDSAVDSTTSSTIVGQSDSLKVTGWVADQVDGAPLTNVKVYIDGTAVGTPTLGIPRYGVAVDYDNPAYLDSGYQLLDPASSLSVGTHAVTVIAVDSGGRSTTFGPLSFTVAAAAGGSPPFGSIASVEDNVTFSSTIGQSDSVDVQGWVADPVDGSPLSNVTVYIDGTLAGTPTLGIASPTVAAMYGNAAYAHARFELLYAASSLSLGQHKLTVVAVDSGGRSVTLGPHNFTVAATAAAGPPVGTLEQAVDSTTLTTTVSPSDSVLITGWVADPTDGSPLTNVKVYIDEVLAGTPTLGLISPAVAAEYNNPAYRHARYQFLYSASTLAPGTHWVTVVATDSGGRSTTFGPSVFTVQ